MVTVSRGQAEPHRRIRSLVDGAIVAHLAADLALFATAIRLDALPLWALAFAARLPLVTGALWFRHHL